MSAEVEQYLDEGWEAAATAPDSLALPSAIEGLNWIPARVPGTAAAALHDAGALEHGEAGDLDSRDWWFRTRFTGSRADPGEEVDLRLDGLATVAEVYLNGHLILESESMFARHRIDVGERLEGQNELAIRFRALGPLLHARRRPRARWRTRLVAKGNLRFYRTMLIGRTPGFAPGPAPVGPWREISIARRREAYLDKLDLRTRVEGTIGVLAVHARLRTLAGPSATHLDIELSGASGEHRASLPLAQDGDTALAEGELRIPEIELWWPHTHGKPTLHEVRVYIGPRVLDERRVGFRSIAAGPVEGHDVEDNGLDLHVNGVRTFCRGAIWTSADPIGLAPAAAVLRRALERVRDCGMNMLRLPGTGAYESQAFHDLCDELGVLVWQDFMFANMDYPVEDEAFCTLVEAEVRDVLSLLGSRPSLAVLCGNSEVEQQVAMLGLDRRLGRGRLFTEIMPRLVRETNLDALYIPSAPCGGDFPFRPNAGVANYFGVGGYRRPLSDVRQAEVRFASECLALANVPDEPALEDAFSGVSMSAVVHHPRWKAGVARDVGAGWDFDDVRDYYFRVLFGLDPTESRAFDPERYLELSRAVSGEVMAEVFGEWRRAASPCGGGLVLWLRDQLPGAGWGLLDHRGEPKVAYHHLRRILAPVAVWTTDEGLNGTIVHVANERPFPLHARLRVALYRDLEVCVDETDIDVMLAAHTVEERDIEAMFGRFLDVGWAYRFGAPGQDLIVASLEQDSDAGTRLISQAVRFPVARPTATESAPSLGLEIRVRPREDGGLALTVRSRRLAYGVRVRAPGFDSSDDAFSVEPGREREVLLHSREQDVPFVGGDLTALNLRGRVRIQADGAAG